MINSIIGDRYEILEEIGKGGMAYVYKAKCVLLNRTVAIKMLRDDLEGGDEFLERFNIEAQAAASLAHPNIVSIFDVGVHENTPYIVMEYVDGITLKEYIVQNGRLDYKEALDIAYQICDAMQAAHDKNIVHRDIKPHNILITDDRNIKVTDFGIARAGNGNTISAGGDILGSVHYISPEQARGERVDNRSDLYSLGIAMYEMISGKLPFEADTPVAVAMMQIEGKAEPLSIPGMVLPEGIQQIIFKAISKDVDLRYQNAEEFKNDIINVFEDSNYTIKDGTRYFSYAKSDLYYEDENGSQITVAVNRKARYLMIALAAITSFIIVAGISILATPGLFQFSTAVKTEVENNIAPNLVGKSLQDAQETCSAIGVKLLVQDEVNDSSAEPGSIVSQTPEADEKLDGTVIKVVINKSHDDVFKDYKNQLYEDVQKELEDNGYEVRIIFEESKVDKDRILRQSPVAGTKLKSDAIVTLYVSGGIDETTNFSSVPTLINMTYDKCLAALEAAGLKIGTVGGVPNPSGDDIVVSQTIPAGSLVKKDSAVSVTLKNPEPEIEHDNGLGGNVADSPDYPSDEDMPPAPVAGIAPSGGNPGGIIGGAYANLDNGVVGNGN
ncbi:MAG: Stk1 family PASTA domain-containing Ser/Thr kinase [Ruminococcaceae bacterium]|nr:Stk1 family PASTA domain-containing Ser/Thr kinase [Oscillospiraceae bacterium]